MDQQAVIRRVRIAVSVFFGVVAVALCALWARSHRNVDVIVGPAFSGQSFWISSFSGSACIAIDPAGNPPVHDWKYFIMAIDDSGAHGVSTANAVSFHQSNSNDGIVLPYWSLVASACGFVAIPWIRRFSLCSMLIATTLVAAVLGLGVWLAR